MSNWLPLVLLCLTFACVFYILMPNTKVIGRRPWWGGWSGALFHLNNMASVLYVSRLFPSSKIYGSLDWCLCS